ncbi:helix-turn-helix transcriptional regulator [Roseicyclus persicicus]|uniref:Helix-turn-helix domain-containing protein n=1 Tax=Roseicyclus persicicus TaxID=2650661 RepID=A0A7X6JWM9_9RHOB|nr:helix-turn-helix domain-containing protein [Roseibacterium persicicum]NKX44622.1 helix-turn-helix domain-containing protein [Roseibacterium persicicum]
MKNQTKANDNTSSKGNTWPNSAYLRPAEAAQYTAHSESTLAKLRMRHLRERGPVFIKRGGVVLYRRADLDTWLASFLVE